MSAIETVQKHLSGPNLRPVPIQVRGAARELARRADQAKLRPELMVEIRPGEFEPVHLSPYMEVVLGIQSEKRAARAA